MSGLLRDLNNKYESERRFFDCPMIQLSQQSIAAYNGWLKWCDSANLRRKIEQKYKR